MSNEDRDIDALLRRNAEQQLAGFDWDRQRQIVMQHLTPPRIQKLRRVSTIRIAAGVAAVLTMMGYVGMSLLRGPDRHAGAPTEVTAMSESAGGDSLLACTDPTMILLTGSARWLVLNDPTLTPHSPWDQ